MPVQATGTPSTGTSTHVAAEALSSVFGDTMTAWDVGPRFTCTETNEIAIALIVLDRPEAAATLLAAHATADDPGDEHWRITHVVPDGSDVDDWTGDEPAHDDVETAAATYVAALRG